MFGRTKKPPLWLRVTLLDGQTFEAEVGDGSLFLGNNFVRVNLDDDECLLYPMHRVKKVRYYRREDKIADLERRTNQWASRLS